jgi:hypothetical protein
MSLALVVVCTVTRRWSGAVLAAVGPAAAAGLTDYVLRPYVGGALGDNFPSKHATSMFALAAVCVVLLARGRLRERFRLLLAIVALALATAVAVSVVANGARTFTDTLAGGAVGIAVVPACTLVLDQVASRWSRFAASQSAELTGSSYEDRVWSYFQDYAGFGKRGYIYVLGIWASVWALSSPCSGCPVCRKLLRRRALKAGRSGIPCRRRPRLCSQRVPS